MTTGIVSQIGRLFPDPSYGFSIPDIIQTDAAINPGNSGGPLLNMKGDVIGLNTGILSSTGGFSGIGFAIPSNTIKKIIPVLIENGTYTHPYLGLTGASLTSDLTQRFKNLPSDLKGVVVDSIVKNGSADKSGIKGSTADQYGQKHGGDIITSVDGKNITRFDDLVSYLEQNKSPGNNITLTVYRDGKYEHVNIMLAGRPGSFITSSIPYPPPNPSPVPPKPPNRAPTTP
jgi:S1-C subfamily serine protease